MNFFLFFTAFRILPMSLLAKMIFLLNRMFLLKISGSSFMGSSPNSLISFL